jgi:hypothetical protein
MLGSMKLLIILLHLLILLLMALQSFMNHSLFQNCLPLFSILLLMSPGPHFHLLQMFSNWLKPSQFRFSDTSSAFWFKKSKLYTRIELLHSTEVSQPPQSSYFLCFVDCASLYNLVNKANLVHNFLVYLFLVYLSIYTCFGQLYAHHQEKQPCLCDTCYLLFCVDDCLVCRIEFHPAYQTVIQTE